jgi:hypothetical protein
MEGRDLYMKRTAPVQWRYRLTYFNAKLIVLHARLPLHCAVYSRRCRYVFGRCVEVLVEECRTGRRTWVRNLLRHAHDASESLADTMPQKLDFILLSLRSYGLWCRKILVEHARGNAHTTQPGHLPTPQPSISMSRR